MQTKLPSIFEGNKRRIFTTLLEYKAELYETYVVEVDAAGTMKECAKCVLKQRS